MISDPIAIGFLMADFLGFLFPIAKSKYLKDRNVKGICVHATATFLLVPK